MKRQLRDEIIIDLQEASTLTGYSVGYIRNLAYKGELKKLGKPGKGTKSNGIAKRGQKIRLYKREVLEKLGQELL